MDDETLYREIARIYKVAAVRVHPRRQRIEWSDEHDEQILEAMRIHGPRWRAVARATGFGSEDAIRNRVLRMDPARYPAKLRALLKNIQRPRHVRHERKHLDGPSHKPYSAQEDSIIWQELVASSGNSVSWKRLSREVLTHRSNQSIRNRAYRLVTIHGNPCGVDPWVAPPEEEVDPQVG